MVVVGRLDQLDRLACGLHRRGEVTVLALEVRRFVGAVGNHDRRAQQIEVALRAHRVLHLIGELDVAAAL